MHCLQRSPQHSASGLNHVTWRHGPPGGTCNAVGRLDKANKKPHGALKQLSSAGTHQGSTWPYDRYISEADFCPETKPPIAVIAESRPHRPQCLMKAPFLSTLARTPARDKGSAASSRQRLDTRHVVITMSPPAKYNIRNITIPRFLDVSPNRSNVK